MPAAEGLAVVVTGASSGIGRATARLFCSEGARVILVARSHEALEDAVAECRLLGGEALPFAADMRDAGRCEEIRTHAVTAFGRIDVWVNCAATLVFGRFEDIPPDMFRLVVDNNVLGYVHGSRTALRQFRNQEDHGCLINVGSMLGVVPEPYVSAYVASKFAIRGLTACIRQEVRGTPGIRVSTILPAAIDTPMYQKAANLFGRQARSILPVYRAERAANAILRAVKRPRRELRVGGFAVLLDLGWRAAPGLVERAVALAARRLQFRPEEQSPTQGNLEESLPPSAVSGGWRAYWWGLLTGSRKRAA